GDPGAGPPALEHQVARHLEEEIAREKYSRSEAIDGIRESELLLHLQRRKPEVDAVQVRRDIKEKQKRHEPPGERSHDDVFHTGTTAVGEVGKRQYRKP